jgi:hypothetical protein
MALCEEGPDVSSRRRWAYRVVTRESDAVVARSRAGRRELRYSMEGLNLLDDR